MKPALHSPNRLRRAGLFRRRDEGSILSINPDATIVDITHEIPPQDVQAAAFNLLACHKDFPNGTIHVAVVDPGVGSDRRAVLVECANQFFIGPDNGLFSWITEREGDFSAWQITIEKFFGNRQFIFTAATCLLL